MLCLKVIAEGGENNGKKTRKEDEKEDVKNISK